uniref:Tc1-like transposase DDE domain-containing protein n=1 Tax=Phytophthora ramorum TaxID=164328 RepID=H3GPF7_PHYRM
MPRRPHSAVSRGRVLEAHRAGEDWMLVAKHNGISPTTARRIVASGREEPSPRGGARSACIKCTPEIVAALDGYLSDDCTYTLRAMKAMILFDFGVNISTSTISDRLLGMLYTLKQVRVEPQTCNNEVNKTKRKQFAVDLCKHMDAGDFVVYYDETNFNVYCKRSQGRARKGERATVVLPPSKGANLQIQCAVSTEVGLVHHRLERGSIRMDVNASFVDEIYENVKASPTFQEHFEGKKIVVVLDNAPAHSQTEERVVEHDDLVLLRLAPYSPTCNPIEGCFSVLKARIKANPALPREELVASRPQGQIAEGRMRILERAA